MAAKAKTPSVNPMKVINDDIKNKTYKRVYLLFGDERYLVTQYRDKLVGSVKDDMNFSSYTGAKLDLSQIEGETVTMPFLGEYRVTLVDGSGLFGQKSSEKLSEIIRGVGDRNILIFCEVKVDKRNASYKLIKEGGGALEFTSPSESDLIKWLMILLSRDGLEIEYGVAELLYSRVGNDMSMLSNEAAKLHDYCLEKGRIGKADVERVCVGQVEDKIFDMCDAIVLGNANRAIDLYTDLIDLRVPAMKIRSLIEKHYETLAVVSTMMEEKASDADIAKVAGRPAFSIKKYRAQAMRYSHRRILAGVNLCQETMYSIVTGRLSDKHAVENLIISLVRIGADT